MKRTKQILSVFLSFCMIVSCMVGMSVTAAADTTVTWNKSDINMSGIIHTSSGDSFTKDGVTVNCDAIDAFGDNVSIMNLSESTGTFTTTLGNFTKIEVTAMSDVSGTGWSRSDMNATWTGEASSSVPFKGSIMGFEGLTIVFTIAPAHTHSFTYSASGATITANCTDCSLTEAQRTITISAPASLTYDGSAKAATLSTGYDTTDAFKYVSEITYTKQGDTSFTGTPTAPGTYTASVSAGASAENCVTASVTFTITAGTPTITTPPTASAITYGQTLADSELSNGAASVEGAFAWKTPTTKPAVSDSNSTEYTVVFTPTDSTSYSAVETTVTLTVNPADPTTPTGLTATEGQTLADVALPTGWTWDSPTTSVGTAGTHTFPASFTETTGNYNHPTAVALTVTVKAKPAPVNCTVTFDTDGGTPEPDPISKTVDYGGKVSKPETDPEKEGYSFMFWSENGRTEYDFSSVVISDTTLKAIYSANKYTITFDSDGGRAVAPITQDYGTVVTKPYDPIKTGYTFDGWEPALPATMPAEDMTVKAKWTVDQYTITFDTAGGTAIAPITQDYGTAVTKPADPTRDGYAFLGWNKEIPATMPAWNMTITARWADTQPHPVVTDPVAPVTTGTTTTTTTTTTYDPKMWTKINADNSVTVGWTGFGYGTKYVLYEVVDGKNVKITETDKTTVNIKNTKNNTQHFYRLGYMFGGVSVELSDNYTAATTVYYKPAPKAKAEDGSILLSWKKVPNAEKYRVYKLVNGKMKLVTETEKNSVRFRNTKPGKTYTFAVKALVDGKWTTLKKSDRVSIKAK